MAAERPRPSVLTVGGALIDTIAVIGNESIERMSMTNADRAFLLLEQGSKTEAEIVSTHPGGGALNTAVSFARLGFNVAALIKISNDERGKAVQHRLSEEGISGQFVVSTEEAPTGASVLISAHDRDAAIFTFRGANTLLNARDLDPKAFERNVVYVSGLSDRSADCFPEISRLAQKTGAFLATNPGIRQLTTRGDAFEKSLPHIDLLSMNVDEAQALVPRLAARTRKDMSGSKGDLDQRSPSLMRRGLTSGGFTMSLQHVLSALLDLGTRCVLLTDGKRGAFAAIEGGLTYCPSLKLDVVGTAGAGDAFSSTFTALFATGSNVGEALQAATVNAGSVVRFADTQTGLLTSRALKLALAQAKGELRLQVSKL